MEIENIWYGFEEKVSIASRQETSINEAPSIVSVITAEEIKNMEFRTFADVLRTVPGFEIRKMGDYGNVVPVVRGIDGANKVRVMLNGHLVNFPLWGDAFMYFDDFPVENIKKIEFIRGPGSAMYGENAFKGVINIITNNAEDINSVRVNTGYGSFDTIEENITFGKRYGDIAFSGLLHYRTTNGHEGTINSDTQTLVDSSISSLGYAKTSEAPGSVEDWRREYNLNLKTIYKDFYIEGLYINKDTSSYLGPQYVLSDESDIELNYVFVEAGYKKTFEEILTFRPRIYYDQFERNGYFELISEEGILPLDLDGDGAKETLELYSDGLIGQTWGTQKIAGAELPVDYQIFDENTVTLGMEFRLINQTNIRYETNFDPITYESLGSIQNFSDTLPYIEEVTRRI
ncbi:MAG: TonB-dependent receptor plug domain-containing protein [Candidatus Kuenenia sp.]|nr:TonB-dependent receptor plug domain-containing protein [Candidatus Kuenenia hertensis]